MRARPLCRALALVAALVSIAHPLVVRASAGDYTADTIVGQPDAFSRAPNFGSDDINAEGLDIPVAAAFDAQGNLYVVDFGNNRVLGYYLPMTTDTEADLVTGQPDFESNIPNPNGVAASSLYYPADVAVSPAGDVYVADRYNNRVLEYDRPFETDSVADRVFGQPNFTSNERNNGGIGAGTLVAPGGLAVESV